MNKPYCIDTNIIIWGIKRQASEGQREMIVKAENFFKYCDDSKIEIIIPTIVIAEVLSVEPKENQIKYLKVFNDSFRVCDFDVPSAMKCAELLQINYSDLKELIKNEGIRKDKMKFDFAIIATEITNNASCIYSNDPDLERFAKNLIEVKDLSSIWTTGQSLFR